MFLPRIEYNVLRLSRSLLTLAHAGLAVQDLAAVASQFPSPGSLHSEPEMLNPEALNSTPKRSTV